MNYIELIKNFWELNLLYSFSGNETKLYFYLVETANRLRWEETFWHTDTQIIGNVGIAKGTFDNSRNRLKQAGLINFMSGGKGYANKSRYQILAPNSIPKSLPNSVPNSIPKSLPLKKTKTKTKTKPPVCPPQAVDDAKAASVKFSEIEFVDKMVLYFNATCKNLNPVKSTTAKRRSAVLARYREHGQDAIKTVIDKAAISKFMSGQGATGWVATFDWIFKPTNFLKTYEGNYDDKQKPTTNGEDRNSNDLKPNDKKYGSMSDAKADLLADLARVSGRPAK